MNAYVTAYLLFGVEHIKNEIVCSGIMSSLGVVTQLLHAMTVTSVAHWKTRSLNFHTQLISSLMFLSEIGQTVFQAL